MPTQEERLNALEQAWHSAQKFQETASAHIRETEENTTILLGVIRSQGRDIKLIVERLGVMDTRLETMDAHLGAVDTRLEAMDTRLETMDVHLGAVDTRLEELTEIKATLAQILARLPEKS